MAISPQMQAYINKHRQNNISKGPGWVGRQPTQEQIDAKRKYALENNPLLKQKAKKVQASRKPWVRGEFKEQPGTRYLQHWGPGNPGFERWAASLTEEDWQKYQQQRASVGNTDTIMDTNAPQQLQDMSRLPISYEQLRQKRLGKSGGSKLPPQPREGVGLGPQGPKYWRNPSGLDDATITRGPQFYTSLGTGLPNRPTGGGGVYQAFQQQPNMGSPTPSRSFAEYMVPQQPQQPQVGIGSNIQYPQPYNQKQIGMAMQNRGYGKGGAGSGMKKSGSMFSGGY